MAAPNIVNVTTITGKTAVQAITTTPADIITNNAASNTVLKVNTLIIANIDGTAAADVTVSVFRSSTQWRIANTISVPADSSLIVIDKNSVIYLEEGDAIRLTASANGDLEAVCSYEIIG